ncbi:MAG: LysM peptidoglycan-binding domain-containing protein [Verrucomicrobiae bacterium]
MKNRTTRPPVTRRAPRRILRPLHARAATREEEVEDYEGGSEPNMKFSHALIVVLVLHVLAVGGVLAFNMLKTTHALPAKQKAPAAEKQDARAQAVAATAAAPAAKSSAKTEAKPAAADVHTVAAGDTLTKIASQHKTTVEAIEKSNGLDAATPLRIGQVINVPSPLPAKISALKESAPASKTSEAKPAAAAVATTKTVAVKPAVPAAAADTAEKTATHVAKAPVPVVPPKAVAVKPAVPAAAPSTAEKVPIAAPVAAAKAAASPEPKPAASPAAKEQTSKGTHTVAKGENPYSIAKKCKVSYSELLKANKIEDPTKLQIGQKLIIP